MNWCKATRVAFYINCNIRRSGSTGAGVTLISKRKCKRCPLFIIIFIYLLTINSMFEANCINTMLRSASATATNV